MTEATWDDFVSPDGAGIVPVILDAIEDAISGPEPAWDEWTPTSTDDVGDVATAEADAEVSLAADLVGDGDFAGAYDALGSAQGFTDVAADAYDAGY